MFTEKKCKCPSHNNEKILMSKAETEKVEKEVMNAIFNLSSEELRYYL